jgi:hypothetical protein
MGAAAGSVNARSGVVRALVRRPRTTLRIGYSTRFAVLLRPLVVQGRLVRGILWVMGSADWIKARFPDVQRYFVLISTAAGKRGWAVGRVEDIHGLTLDAHAADYRAQFPEGRCLLIRNADFIDEREFYPVETPKIYDVLFNSTFSAVKRHERFLATLYDLRDNYGVNLRAAVIAWSAAPRLRNSRLFPELAYRTVGPLLENGQRRYARHIHRSYETAIEDGVQVDILQPVYRSSPGAIAALRSLYSRSKVHVLLSKTEGCNRATKEAILCNVPGLAIAGSVAATELVNERTGKAVSDTQREISEGILHLVRHHADYAPRQWALESCPRAAAVERLWWKVNEVERYPGYPSIEAANALRREAGARARDNHRDLNGWNGAGSSGVLGTEMRNVRREFRNWLPRGGERLRAGRRRSTRGA